MSAAPFRRLPAAARAIRARLGGVAIALTVGFEVRGQLPANGPEEVVQRVHDRIGLSAKRLPRIRRGSKRQCFATGERCAHRCLTYKRPVPDIPVQIEYNKDLKPLDEVLRGVKRPGDFSVSGALELPMPRLEIEGAGVISFSGRPIEFVDEQLDFDALLRAILRKGHGRHHIALAVADDGLPLPTIAAKDCFRIRGGERLHSRLLLRFLVRKRRCQSRCQF